LENLAKSLDQHFLQHGNLRLDLALVTLGAALGNLADQRTLLGKRGQARIILHMRDFTMPKEVQMSIKMEATLRSQFMAAAALQHRPAAQVVRDLMRLYIAESETPNALTVNTLRKSDAGEDVFYASDASDLFKQLSI